MRPPSPFRLPSYGGADGTMRVERGVVSRLLTVEGSPVVVRAWEPGRGRVIFRAEPVDGAGPAELGLALERMRFALGVDDDLGPFYRRFRRDPLLGPAFRRRPHKRLQRRPWPWEALAWAVVRQLIESGRAARIQRRIVARWGLRCSLSPVYAHKEHRKQEGRVLRDVPAAATIAGRAPAELAAMDLSPARSIALRAVAREVAAGRCNPGDSATDRRLLAVPEIGPWTVQCLGLLGRGDPDSLPAGDLIYLKLVGRLARLGRRATVEEVEEFFAPYEPYRGLAGAWTAGMYG